MSDLEAADPVLAEMIKAAVQRKRHETYSLALELHSKGRTDSEIVATLMQRGIAADISELIVKNTANDLRRAYREEGTKLFVGNGLWFVGGIALILFAASISNWGLVMLGFGFLCMSLRRSILAAWLVIVGRPPEE